MPRTPLYPLLALFLTAPAFCHGGISRVRADDENIPALCVVHFDELFKATALSPQPKNLMDQRVLIRYVTELGAHHALSGIVVAETEDSYTLLAIWGDHVEIPKKSIRRIGLLTPPDPEV